MKLTIEVDEELYEKLFSDSFAVRILSVEECAVEMIRNGYEFHKLLSENRTPRYSHRNGETQLPDITDAHYWYEVADSDPELEESGIVHVDDWGRVRDTFYSNAPLVDLKGRWWGPIVPPWIARPTE